MAYLNGSTQLGVDYTVSNIDPAGRSFSNIRLYASGALLPGRWVSLIGLSHCGAVAQVGAQGLYNGVGGSDSLLEISAWDHFQEATARTVDAAVGNNNPGSHLSDTVAPEQND